MGGLIHAERARWISANPVNEGSGFKPSLLKSKSRTLVSGRRGRSWVPDYAVDLKFEPLMDYSDPLGIVAGKPLMFLPQSVTGSYSGSIYLDIRLLTLFKLKRKIAGYVLYGCLPVW